MTPPTTILGSDEPTKESPDLDIAIEMLETLQRPDGGWPYQPAQQAGFTEPTCWSALALHAAGRLDDRRARAVASFLQSAQTPTGGLCNGTVDREANWVTSLGILALTALDRDHALVDRCVDWLLGFEGVHWPHTPDSYFAHDTSIVGWPWIADTHSWTEPTCYCLCALRRAGMGDHPRVAEARRLLINRALPRGGWNYGNTLVLGTELRAFPSTTAMALIALQSDRTLDPVRRAWSYLAGEFPSLRSAWAMGWTLLAARVYGFVDPCPLDRDKTAQAADRVLQRTMETPESPRVHELAVLLLSLLENGHLTLGLPA